MIKLTIILLVLIFTLALQSTPIPNSQGGPNGSSTEIPKRLIQSEPKTSQFDLTFIDRHRVILVNMIPRSLSGETGQDSEPFLAVHPDQKLLVGAAYTKNPAGEDTSPLYLSKDGGLNWELTSIVPAASVYDQTYCFSGTGRKLYGAIIGADAAIPNPSDMNVSVLETDDPTLGDEMHVISPKLNSGPGADQPFIEAHAFSNQDRIYVGQNYFGFTDHQNQTASVRVSTDSGKSFSLLGLDVRPGTMQDAPPVRPSAARDGTVYVAFIRWTDSSEENRMTRFFKGDVVVCRDDKGAVGPNPFVSLIDPVDRKPCQRVELNRIFPFSFGPYLGKQRVGSALSLVVDPHNSASVYLAWGDQTNGTYTVHLRRSTDSGQTWSDDLLSIASATNPALAVADNGTVGFLYQQLVAAGKPQERWETHFSTSLNGATGWTDMTLATIPTSLEPQIQFQPYLGGKIHLLSLGNSFYGVFSAPNIPDRTYFPQGVLFQRNYKDGKLLSVDGSTQVAVSIDPYFFYIPADLRALTSSLAPGTALETQMASPKWYLPLGVALVTSAMGLLFIWWFAKRRVPENVKGAVEEVLTQKIQGPTVTNYTGFLAAKFVDESGQTIAATTPGKQCKLMVQFVQQKPEGTQAELIDLRDGEDAPEVIFRLSVDSGRFKIRPNRQTITVPAKGPAQAPFDVETPKEAGEYHIYVQVFQKTRLVQVIGPTLVIQEST